MQAVLEVAEGTPRPWKKCEVATLEHVRTCLLENGTESTFTHEQRVVIEIAAGHRESCQRVKGIVLDYHSETLVASDAH